MTPEIVFVAIVCLFAGFVGGLWFAGDAVGRQLKADLKAGRISEADARRLIDLRDAR